MYDSIIISKYIEKWDKILAICSFNIKKISEKVEHNYTFFTMTLTVTDFHAQLLIVLNFFSFLHSLLCL